MSIYKVLTMNPWSMDIGKKIYNYEDSVSCIFKLEWVNESI